MTPKPMSIDEHALIGLELCAMSERLRILGVRIKNFYGAQVGVRGSQAADAIDCFRDQLVAQLLDVCPESFEDDVSGIYHCAERLNALRDEQGILVVAERILGMAGRWHPAGTSEPEGRVKPSSRPRRKARGGEPAIEPDLGSLRQASS